MITQAILNVFQSVVTFFLSALPSIPQMDASISAGLDGFKDVVVNSVGLLAYIYTSPVLVGVFTILWAILLFDPIYKFSLWVYHKIRG